jgi:hypothetical protein
MGLAALISWLVTAFVGLYLLAVWLIENDVTHKGTARSHLPGPVILGHVLLALTGLGVWVIYLLSDTDMLAWTALGILLVIVALGLTMFTRWIPVHRAFAAASEGPRNVSAEFDFPAERNFPVSVVVGHGFLASTTLILVLFTVLGVGGS